MFSKTEFAGVKNTDDTYTKSHLVAVDFIEDKHRSIYEFDSFISTIHMNDEGSALCYEKNTKVS